MTRRLLPLVVLASLQAAGCVTFRYARCEGELVDVTSDPGHCSGCRRECPEGARCAGGRCVAPEGTTVCIVPAREGAERTPPPVGIRPSLESHHWGPLGAAGLVRRQVRDLGVDRESCGQCGRVCPERSSCVDGTCRCEAGLALCETLSSEREGELPRHVDETWWELHHAGEPTRRDCVDLSADPESCGACGSACPEGATCHASRCHCVEGRWREPTEGEPFECVEVPDEPADGSAGDAPPPP